MQPQQISSFEQFGLKPALLKAVQTLGFKTPSPVQAQVIPLIIEGRDVIGQAQTGTGKTAAFGLSTLHRIDPKLPAQILIVTPTRELAGQVADELFSLGSAMGIKTVAIYGGQSYTRQLDLLRRGAQVVVATPGRMLDLLRSKKLKNFSPKIVVLDEADEMLDMGFIDDVKSIFEFLPADKQTLLFSATMPQAIQKLAKSIMRNPAHVSVTPKEMTSQDIAQRFYVIEEYERTDAVMRLLDAEQAKKSIIFCRTRSEVDNLAQRLSSQGYLAKGLHGDIEQRNREKIIAAFRENEFETLVATDVAARGLNVVDVTHVFNYHLPFDPESYVHRIGRTGRAGRKGIAITLVTPKEFGGLRRIAQMVGNKIEQRMVPTISEVKSTVAKKLIGEIKHQHVHPEAARMCTHLLEEMTMDELVFKLLSSILDKQLVSGPERIGPDPSRLKTLLEPRRESRGRPDFKNNNGPRRWQPPKGRRPRFR